MPVIKPREGAPQAAQQATMRIDEKLMAPGRYEVTKDSIFKVRVPLRQKAGEKWWILCSEKEAETIEEVTFRMWGYDEMVEMRKMATVYDQIRRVHMIDHDLMNRLKMQRFMLAWTFAKDNPRLVLHHVGGVLTDESWRAVTRLQTNILRFLMEAMNERYDSG